MKQAMASPRRVAQTQRMYNPLEQVSVYRPPQRPKPAAPAKARKLHKLGKLLIWAGAIIFPAGVLGYIVGPFVMIVIALTCDPSLQSDTFRLVYGLGYAVFIVLATAGLFLGPPLAIAGLVVLWMAEQERKKKVR